MSRTFERIVDAGDLLLRVDEARRKLVQRLRSNLLIPQVIGQRLQSLVARNRRLGSPLGAIRQVEILQFGAIKRRLDLGLQLFGELALLGDGRENRGATTLQLAQVGDFLR